MISSLRVNLLLRATLSLSMFLRLAVRTFRARRARAEAANHTLRTMRRTNTGSDHLGKKVDVVISFARHLFPNRVQHFQKSWATIHSQLTFSVASETRNSGVTIIGT